MAEGIVTIKVFGVGGGGCNAVNRMVDSGIKGVKFYAVNTDAQALSESSCKNKIVLGTLGAGADPKVGKQAAEDHVEDIKKAIKGADMVYIACGEGGGTGTGASPIIAKLAKEMGCLTVAIVTKPFKFEGARRIKQAEEGIAELRKWTDSLILISNEKLLEVYGNVPMQEAFIESDNVLKRGVQAVTDLILRPSLINLDFADVKWTMSQMGQAVVGMGAARGANRVVDAAKAALTSPLLEVELSSAKKIIINITGDDNISIADAHDAVETIKKLTNLEADVIFGVSTDKKLKETALVTVIVTGVGEKKPEVKKVVVEPPKEEIPFIQFEKMKPAPKEEVKNEPEKKHTKKPFWSILFEEEPE